MVVSWRRFGVCLWVVLLGVLVGCGSSSDDDDDDDMSSGSGGSGSNKGSGGSGGPVGNDLQVVFSPMYSAYDGEHVFRVPAIVNGLADVKWSASDPSYVDLDMDAIPGGVMITTKKAGTVDIIARSGALSGKSTLTITAATPAEWSMGQMRYNNEIPFPMISLTDADGGMVDPSTIMIPDNLSCGNCHGTGAMALDIEHTPQQTGGLSDEDLIKIFTMGMKPPGAPFRTQIPEFIYTMFHTWGATPAEQKGIVIYLRSIEPKSQGPIDFAGLINMGPRPMGTGGAAASTGTGGAP